MSVCLLLVSVALIQYCLKMNIFVVTSSYIYKSKTNLDCFVRRDDMISYLLAVNNSGLLSKSLHKDLTFFKFDPIYL